MYSVTVPIIGSRVNASNREAFLHELQRTKANRFLLSSPPAVEEFDVSQLKDNIAYFKSHGLEVGIWVCTTIGHGATLIFSEDTGEKSKYQQLVDLGGQELYDANCPYDKAFQEDCGAGVAKYAALGADFILLDDDFRLSQHSGDYCCACELHMAKIREYCGENISREELKKLAFSGKRNKYRDAWLRAQGESLRELARAIRRAVDSVNPDCPVAVCSAYCSWDHDGVDPIEITDILAGKNRKLLRLHGAPYWAFVGNHSIIGVCEIGRMFASFLKDRPDIEIISEGDSFRPRYNMPSSYLEFFDAALRADGKHDGILKYLFNYGTDPHYERSYVDRHCKRYERLHDINRYFGAGANAGVRILVRPHLMQDANFDDSPFYQQSPLPMAGLVLAMCGIPTVYVGEGICNAVFGESARHFDTSYYEKGAILDAVSALILTEQGIDVGIESHGAWQDCRFNAITEVESGRREPAVRGAAKLLDGHFKASVKPELTVQLNGCEHPLAYSYENAVGQRFLVFTFLADELARHPAFLRSYEVQAVMARLIPWVAGQPLPAFVGREIELYTLCRKGEQDSAVLLLNNYYDSILSPEIVLDRSYTQIECTGCQAHLEGNRVVFDTEIPAFDFAAVRVFD